MRIRVHTADADATKQFHRVGGVYWALGDYISGVLLFRSWYGWFEGQLNIHEMIIPDVSRVSRRQFMGLTENVDFIRAYFNRPRVTSKSVLFLSCFIDR